MKKKRKKSSKKENSFTTKQTWIAFAVIIVLISTITVIPKLFAPKCPQDTFGKNNATYVKYFSSPFCIACWYQKPIIEKLAKENPDSFMIDEFDVDFCKSAQSPYYIKGIPAFLSNGTVVYGLQSEEALKQILDI